MSSGPRRRKKGKPQGSNALPLILGATALVAMLVVGGIAWVVLGRGPAQAGPAAGFAPGGTPVDTTPAVVTPGVPAGPGSRFDLPAGPGGKVAPAVPAGPVNNKRGWGLNATVGVTKYWNRRNNDKVGEYEILKEAPDVLPPALWSVPDDPPAEPLEYDTARKTPIRIKVPKGSKDATQEDIVFPVVPSPFVAVGQNHKKSDVREIWNMTTQQKVGTITDLAATTTMNALSPDGKLFAGLFGRGNDTVIGVWDIEKKEALVDIPAEQRSIEWLAFATPTRIVGYGSWSKTIGVWEVPSGDKIQELEYGGWSKSFPAISPGGKYLAIPRAHNWEESLAIFDIEAGLLVGELTMPGYGINGKLNPVGLAFSPEGDELAAVVDSWSCSKILIWKLSTGELVDHATFPKKLRDTVANNDPWFKANPIVMFPGHQHVLAYEHGVVDRETGAIVFNVPRSGVNFPGERWPLSPTHLTVIEVTGKSGAVLVWNMPADKIKEGAARAAKNAAKQSTIPSPIVAEPTATIADLSGLRHLDLKEGAWDVKADPGPQKPATSRLTTLAPASGTVYEIGVAAAAPRAVAMRSTAWIPFQRIATPQIDPGRLKQFRWHSVRTGQSEGTLVGGAGQSRYWVDVYDLTTGKATMSLRLRYGADLMSVSPDGERMLLWAANELNRLDVYKTTDGAHVVSFEPYAGEPGDGANLVGGQLLADDRLLTISATGKLVCWKLPDVQAVWSVENASFPTVSPGGAYVAFSDGESVHFADIATGAHKGRVADVGNVHGIAYHSGGAKLALISEYKAGYYLFTIDAQNGKVGTPFPVPILNGDLEWCGDKHVLIGKSKLVDVDQKVVAWTYSMGAGDFVPTPTGSQHWALVESAGKATLSALTLPDPRAAQVLQGTALQPEFVLEPGGKCTLDVQLGGVSTAGEAEKKARAQLAENKITVEGSQPVTLKMTLTEATTGQIEREFRSIGFFRGGTGSSTVSYPGKATTFRVAFMVGDTAAWETTAVASNDIWFVSVKEGEQIQAVIDRTYHESVAALCTSFQLPPYVFTPRSANGVGETDLAPPAK